MVAPNSDNKTKGKATMRKTMVEDIVTREVRAVKPSSNVLEAARIMKEAEVGAVPVVDDDDKVVGILTDRDLVVRLLAENKDARSVKVEEIMSSGVISCLANQTVDEAAQIMERNKVRRLLVRDPVSEGAVGVISLGDVVIGAAPPVAAETIKEVSKP